MSLNHSWNVTPKQAVKIQKRLAAKIIKKGTPGKVQTIAGCDIAYDPQTKRCFAGVLIFSWPDMKIIEQLYVVEKVRFPYVPGLLTFREAPALLKCFRKLSLKPDLIMVDGQGIAHPRRIGVASHLGLILNIPTIGIAKSRLIGAFKSPGSAQGKWNHLYIDKNKQHDVIGAVVRTRSRVKPVFVSIGHKISLQESIKWVLRTTGKFRIPEPTRQADIFVEKIKRKNYD